MWDPYSEFESCVLPNGLTIYAAHWPDRPWEKISFVVHSGSEMDPVGYEGIAHYVEHLVSRNSSLPYKFIRPFFHDLGGAVELGETTNFSTSFRFWTPAQSKPLAKALEIFGHMLMGARLVNCLEEQRRVIQGEFDRSFPLRSNYELNMREHRALFSGHWLERMVGPIGTPEGIAHFTQPVVQAFYDRHYVPANISVVCLGKLSLDEVTKMLQESPLGDPKVGQRNPIPKPVTSPRRPEENRHIFHTSDFMAEAMSVWNYHSATVLPGTIGLHVLICLAGILDKALDDEVRERRSWAYYASSNYVHYRKFIDFSINCNALTLDCRSRAENVILGGVRRALQNRALFQRIKRRMLADLPMKDLSGGRVIGKACDDLVHAGKIIDFAQARNSILKIQFEDVSNLSKWFEPDRRWTLLTVP